MRSIELPGINCPSCGFLDADASWNRRTPLKDPSQTAHVSCEWIGATHHLKLHCRRCGAAWQADINHEDLPTKFHGNRQ